MPNRQYHVSIGKIAGAGAAAYQARDQALGQLALEVVGGVLGGHWGARVPDMIDPPTSPHHRGVGHAMLPVVRAGTSYANRLQPLQDRLRSLADELVSDARQEQDPMMALLLNALSALVRVVAGAVAGFGVGYASHLLADSFTPAGLPLLCKAI